MSTDFRKLTLEDYKNLPPQIYEEISDYLQGETDEENAEVIREDNWIIGTVEIGGLRANFIHGFPGDNPAGAFYLGQEFCFLEASAKSVFFASHLDWYVRVTKNDYSAFELRKF